MGAISEDGKGELTVTDQGTLSVLTKYDLGDIIKPFISEIFLFETYIAGTSHIEDLDIFKELKKGDGLTLLRENNKFDEKAILILDSKRRKLGYVPEKDNEVFSRLMDAGKKLTAKVVDIDEKGHFWQIKIGIYLVDI